MRPGAHGFSAWPSRRWHAVCRQSFMSIRALALDSAQVPAAIARAASATGVDFAYLLGQAQRESGLNPAAHARTSSASGLFQFIDSTWLSVIKRHGAEHGLGWAADAVQWAGGKLHIADAATRRAVLALKADAQVSALMAGAHAADNKAALEARLGRAVGAAELSLAHFLGLGGATKFLRALARDPAAPAAHAAPHAVHGNHRVFFARDGSMRSLAQVYDRLAAEFGGAVAPRAAPPPERVQLAAGSDATGGPAPAYARAAYIMLADLGA